jgi:micrococcal nuclease
MVKRKRMILPLFRFIIDLQPKLSSIWLGLFIFSLIYSVSLILATPSFAQSTEKDNTQSTQKFIWKSVKPSQSDRQRPYKIPIFAKDPALSNILKITKSKAKITNIIDEQTIVLDDHLVVQLADLYFEYNKNGLGPDALDAYRVLQKEFLGSFVNLYQVHPSRMQNNQKIITQNGFGHELGHLVRVEDDTWLQGTLLTSGLTRTYSQSYVPELTSKMFDMEDRARMQSTGFWAHDEWLVQAADLPDSIKKERFQIIEGTVMSVSTRQNQIYLNFGIDWKTDTTVRISSDLRKTFARLKLNPMDWAHQKLRVRGWVEDFNGPMITILHPSQIELISDNVPTEYKYPEEF